LGGGNIDAITDFSEVQHDMIVLSRTIFAGLTAGSTVPVGDVVAAANPTGPVPTDSGDHILYNTSTGALSYDPDGSGGTAAVQFATLTGHPTLVAGDFSIIA
jgi:Ca2+-binding RTX toxin-like protein